MNIAIIGFAKIKYMPYLNFYLNNIDSKKHNISVFYWNRDSGDDSILSEKISIHSFKYQQNDQVPKYKKIIGFYLFKRAAKKFLNNGNFDKIIILTTYPALLLSGFLSKYFKNRYIFDYRDVSLENIKLFRSRVGKLVEMAEATFVSSRGFLKYLPDKRIYITHNISEDLLGMNLNIILRTELPLRIRYWGLFRDFDYNMKMIDNLCNDSRFEIHYHGREQSIAIKLKEYCSKIGAKNVFFHGEYRPDEKLSFVLETDIIHNAYDSTDFGATLLMSNKYYDGLIFQLPQLCGKDTFMGKCAEDNGIGLMVDPNNSLFADRVCNYYDSIDWKTFRDNCNSALVSVLKEFEMAKNYLRCLR